MTDLPTPDRTDDYPEIIAAAKALVSAITKVTPAGRSQIRAVGLIEHAIGVAIFTIKGCSNQEDDSEG